MSDDTARVNMVWPKDLKERVQDKTGPRGLTEYVIEATETHLAGGGDALAALQKELDNTKHLAQQLADCAAINSSPALRLETFMEIDLPAWIDTAGWPSEFASRVGVPEQLAEIDRNARAYGYEVGKGTEPADVIEVSEDNPFLKKGLTGDDLDEAATGKPQTAEGATEEETPAPEPVAPSVPTPPVDLPDEDDFFAAKAGGNDLFARVMEKTGGDPLMQSLKPASEVPVPEAKPIEEMSDKETRYARDDKQVTDPVIQESVAELKPESPKAQVLLDAVSTDAPLAEVVEGRCPNCGDELVGDECWTCG